MRLVCLALCSLTVGIASVRSAEADNIQTHMRKVHMRGRQVYRSLDQLLVSGRSTADERKQFLASYTSLRTLRPPQGTVEAWQRDIDNITDIVRQMDSAKDEKEMLATGTRLLYATDCKACHERYRYSPKPAPGELAPKTLATGKNAVETGGAEWSAPSKLEKLGHMQPGRRLLVWPENIAYFKPDEANKPPFAQVRFNWVLLPGAEIPDGSPERFYYHFYTNNDPKMHSFQFTGPHSGPKTREGNFTINFDVPKGGGEVAFILVTNWTVPVPLGNFVVLKLREPK